MGDELRSRGQLVMLLAGEIHHPTAFALKEAYGTLGEGGE